MLLTAIIMKLRNVDKVDAFYMTMFTASLAFMYWTLING
ncbi:hypothetical protein JOC34_000377 [Virgibacillus halotolerans]|nr:hypothetical protein [Virgibacillus halotolerans]